MAQPLEIDVATLARLRSEGAALTVLDVREPWEVAVASLPDVLAIPMGQVPARLDEIPSDKLVVVLCHHGGRSMRVTHWLRAHGRPDAVNLRGGIDAWSRQIDPAVSTY